MLTRLTLMLTLTAVTTSVMGQVPLVNRLPGHPAGAEFRIGSVEVTADITDQVAKVQMAQTFRNVSRRILETQFLFPLPDDVAINGLTLIVDGKELPGELKPKDQARREYEAIVRKQKDPALLEYIGQGLFRTSVFPIPAGQVAVRRHNRHWNATLLSRHLRLHVGPRWRVLPVQHGCSHRGMFDHVLAHRRHRRLRLGEYVQTNGW